MTISADQSQTDAARKPNQPDEYAVEFGKLSCDARTIAIGLDVVGIAFRNGMAEKDGPSVAQHIRELRIETHRLMENLDRIQEETTPLIGDGIVVRDAFELLGGVTLDFDPGEAFTEPTDGPIIQAERVDDSSPRRDGKTSGD